MDERENLPAVIAAQAVAVQAEKHGSLVARGMAVLKIDNDALYRQARAVFDRRDSIRNWNQDVAENPALSSAFKIFQRLADENYGKAYYPLSILYSGRNDIEDGDSHDGDYSQLAFDWCFANQAIQDAELWCDLGKIYEFGRHGVERDSDQAAYWFRKAAEQGYARGQFEYSNFLTFDSDDHSDCSGYYWMELAAKQGNSVYQAEIASLYEFFSPQQYQKAVYWYRMAAEQGDGGGQLGLAGMYEKGLGIDQNDELFVYWIRKAAEQGYEPGQWELGEMFANGRSVAQDNEQAEYWFRKAAEQDEYGETQNNLGEMYVTGCGVAEDDKQAVFWFRKAAEQGYEDAQFNLGKMYQEGRSVKKDNEQAAHWFREAAEQGQTYAQYNLGRMYEEGCGVEQDHEQAERWLREVYSEIYGEDGEWYLDEQDHEEYSEWTWNYDHWAQRFPLPLCFPLTFEDATLTTIVPEDVVVTLSHCGYMKAQKLDEYRAQRRGEQTAATNEGDFVENLFIANTHNYILYFSNHGRVYWLKVYEVPQGSHISRGRLIVNLLPLEEGEKINAVFPVSEFDEDKYAFFATANGTVKKTPLNDFSRRMKRGIIAINLDEGDFLIGVALTDGKDDVMLFSDGGKAVRFDENDVRPTGRASRGVRGMKLSEGQKIIALLVPENEQQSVLTATENGYGKRTPITEYTRHGRGTQGMIAILTSARNGKVVAATLVSEDDEVRLITDHPKIIRTRVSDIREMGRVAQGVTLVVMSEGEKLSGLEILVEPIMNWQEECASNSVDKFNMPPPELQTRKEELSKLLTSLTPTTRKAVLKAALEQKHEKDSLRTAKPNDG